jgi:hypothetical protein
MAETVAQARGEAVSLKQRQVRVYLDEVIYPVLREADRVIGALFQVMYNTEGLTMETVEALTDPAGRATMAQPCRLMLVEDHANLAIRSGRVWSDFREWEAELGVDFD